MSSPIDLCQFLICRLSNFDSKKFFCPSNAFGCKKEKITRTKLASIKTFIVIQRVHRYSRVGMVSWLILSVHYISNNSGSFHLFPYCHHLNVDICPYVCLLLDNEMVAASNIASLHNNISKARMNRGHIFFFTSLNRNG